MPNRRALVPLYGRLARSQGERNSIPRMAAVGIELRGKLIDLGRSDAVRTYTVVHSVRPIGRSLAIHATAHADRPLRGTAMRFAIISDIHANLEALEATLRRIDADRIDRIVCLGDIVGYNANPAECVEHIRRSDALCVAGNHDRAVCGQITTDGFSNNAARAVVWTRPRLSADALDFLSGLPLTRCIETNLVAVHGALHPESGQELVRLDTEERRLCSFKALLRVTSGARVCAFGHTHNLGIYEYRNGASRTCIGEEVPLLDDAVYLINPGSVGQPRTAERRATYLVLDSAWQTASVRRVDYDARTAFAKTRAAGLAPRSYPLPQPVRSGLKWAARAVGLEDLLRAALMSMPPITRRDRGP